jgi:hypothetical protein
MFDHLSLVVSDDLASEDFFFAALRPLVPA